MSGAVDLVIDASCCECGKKPVARDPRNGTPVLGTVLVEMKPGEDGMPWYLCVRCWIEGAHPKTKQMPIATGVLEREPPAPPPSKRARRKAQPATR